jgi:hypothetical protein
MTLTVSNDALDKLGQEARRRRMLRYKRAVKPYKSAPGTIYEVAKPPTGMIVSDWYTDGLGNQARIIKARD